MIIYLSWNTTPLTTLKLLALQIKGVVENNFILQLNLGSKVRTHAPTYRIARISHRWKVSNAHVYLPSHRIVIKLIGKLTRIDVWQWIREKTVLSERDFYTSRSSSIVEKIPYLFSQSTQFTALLEKPVSCFCSFALAANWFFRNKNSTWNNYKFSMP